MKIPIVGWMCICLCLIAAAFIAGCYFEKTTMLQSDVIALENRVNRLEMAQIKREERWGWFCRIGSKIPFVKWLIGNKD